MDINLKSLRYRNNTIWKPLIKQIFSYKTKKNRRFHYTTGTGRILL